MAEEPEVTPRKSNKVGILIGFIVLLLLILLVQLYFNTTQYNEIQEKTETIAQQDSTIKQQKAQLDSLETELNAAIERAKQLDGEVANLQQMLEQVKADKAKLSSQVETYKWKADQYNAMKNQIALYKKQLAEANGRIDSLVEANKRLFAETVELKEDKVKLKEEIDDLSAKKQELDEKVKIGKQIRTSRIEVSAVKKSGKEKMGVGEELKARWIDQIKVEVFLADNQIAEVGSTELYVVITNPDGEVLKDLASGGGSFEASGKDLFYTMKQTHMFDNQNDPKPMFYKFEKRPEKGTYKIDVYSDGYKMGTKTLTVK